MSVSNCESQRPIRLACLDKRPPDLAGDVHHVHGQLPRTMRSVNYCPHCKQNPPSIPLRHPSVPERLRKTCGHEYCDLSIPTCCTCTDGRPHNTSYPLHISGVGKSRARWSMYCVPCRDVGNNTQSPVQNGDVNVVQEGWDLMIDEGTGVKDKDGGEFELWRVNSTTTSQGKSECEFVNCMVACINTLFRQ
jgi:hypothetical protein